MDLSCLLTNKGLMIRFISQGDIDISYQDDELVKEIISSISGPSHSSTCTDFISTGLYGQQNGSIYFNGSQDVYCNGNVFGVENADFIGDEVDTAAISENRNFEINYIKFPKSIIKSQVLFSLTKSQAI